MTTLRLLVLVALAGIRSLGAQEFYTKGSMELELHRGETAERTHATFAQRDGVLPPERFATALPLAMHASDGEYKGERGLAVVVHFRGDEAEVVAKGPLASGKSAEPLSGIYRRVSAADHLAAEKARAAAVDAELNRIYGELKAKLKPAQYEELRDAQREWIRYTYESGAVATDPGEDAEAWRTRADHAAERTQFLKKYTPGKANDDTPDLRTQLDAAVEANAWDAAAEIARRIVVISPRDASAWESRVRALVGRDDDRASQALEEWMKSPAAKPPIMDQFRGAIAEGRKQHEEAVKYWTVYLKSAPKDAETRSQLATVHEELGNYAEAAKLLEQRIKLSPSAAAYTRLAVCEVMLRDWKKAGTAIRQGSALDATDETLKPQLPRIERLEKALPAIRAADKIAAGAPREPVPLLDRGLIFVHLGWGELALQEAEQALLLDADSRRGLLQKAVALRLLGRSDELEKLQLDSVSEKLPSEPVLRELGTADAEVAKTQGGAAARAHRATVLNRANQRKLALAEAETALKADPNNDEALTARGRALSRLDRGWEGIADLVRATDLNPKNALAWLTRGEIDAQHLDFPRAIDSLTKALELDPRNRTALELRERSYRALGKIAEADIDASKLKTQTPYSPSSPP